MPSPLVEASALMWRQDPGLWLVANLLLTKSRTPTLGARPNGAPSYPREQGLPQIDRASSFPGRSESAVADLPAIALDREARETGKRHDRFLVLVGERSPARFLGQVQAPVRHVVNEDRDAEKGAHRPMPGRHSITVRVLAEVDKAQRDRIEDQIAEHAPAARPLADPRARVIVDPRRKKHGEAVPGIV
jgi:hypothetical protein